MKVIDLLNRIANNEEIPLKIKYDGTIWEYDGDYYSSKNNVILEEYCNLTTSLNDEVEIIEEPKGIPEKICTNRIINTKDILEFEMIQNKINAEYTYAINWILDYLESKGESND